MKNTYVKPAMRYSKSTGIALLGAAVRALNSSSSSSSSSLALLSALGKPTPF